MNSLKAKNEVCTLTEAIFCDLAHHTDLVIHLLQIQIYYCKVNRSTDMILHRTCV